MTDDELLFDAEARIEEMRKADVTVTVLDAAGQLVPNAHVQVEMTRHEFLFGCNVFPVLGYNDPALETAYENQFAGLFNYATLPFYWGSYEPEPGQTQQVKLAAQARWCREHGITPKGHPLVWHEVYPKWAPTEPEQTREKLKARIADVVGRFSGLVGIWDVVNEVTVSQNFDNGVGHWVCRDGAAAVVEESLRWTHAANQGALLLYNDYNLQADFETLAATLIAKDAPVDAFGLQSHMHHGEWPLAKAWEHCETYARFGKPLHFTELTVISGEHGWELPKPWVTTPEGEARQADYVERLYTLLFSHPAVAAITWWDFNDGAWMGAPSGLVRADLTPKPAYARLLKLVKDAWWTRADLQTASTGQTCFRGFCGEYSVTVTSPAGACSKDFLVRRGDRNAICLVVGVR